MSAKLTGLYLKGVSTGQFEEALAALLGTDAPGLSAATVRRLTEAWQEEHERWQGRDLSSRRYVYLWADGVYFTPRLEHERQCMLVLIGADEQGRKELLAIEDGYRESAQSWRELLLRLRDENGLKLDPELATGDGALGFWQALHEVWPKTRQQRCWVHKVANVLNKLPPSLQGKAKQDLHRIYEAANRQEAEDAFDRFLAKYGSKYDKAVSCLAKDRKALLTFYDFPAEHWKHIRTANPIESTFATVRLRTSKTKGCLSRQTALALSALPTSLRDRPLADGLQACQVGRAALASAGRLAAPRSGDRWRALPRRRTRSSYRGASCRLSRTPTLTIAAGTHPLLAAHRAWRQSLGGTRSTCCLSCPREPRHDACPLARFGCQSRGGHRR